MEAIGALVGALQQFSGGVLVISHDQHFINALCSEIWVVKNQNVVPFDGDIEKYKKVTLTKTRSR